MPISGSPSSRAAAAIVVMRSGRGIDDVSDALDPVGRREPRQDVPVGVDRSAGGAVRTLDGHAQRH